MSQEPALSVGLIGGTGPEGQGLALRLAGAGVPVLIGSRSSERGRDTAASLRERLGSGSIEGGGNAEIAARAGTIVLTLPFAGVRQTLEPLREEVRGKIVVSAIAPIEFREGRLASLRVEAGSAAQEVQQLLPASRVASAFQIIDSHQLQDLDMPLDTDVIVCSDDAEARREIMALAQRIPGVRALSGGRLAASRYVEECTALLITLNRIYKTHTGVRITNINR
jgi:NADPH-dependent F420 reductase